MGVPDPRQGGGMFRGGRQPDCARAPACSTAGPTQTVARDPPSHSRGRSSRRTLWPVRFAEDENEGGVLAVLEPGRRTSSTTGAISVRLILLFVGHRDCVLSWAGELFLKRDGQSAKIIRAETCLRVDDPSIGRNNQRTWDQFPCEE